MFGVTASDARDHVGDNVDAGPLVAPLGRRPVHKPPSLVEVETVVERVRTHRAVLVNVGHGRAPRSIACAGAFIEHWQATGGQIGAVVSWPSVAASWLRPARRLAAGAPDAWVIADTIDGWTGIGRRLAATGPWRAWRTVAFGGLADPRLPTLAGFEASEGLSGSLPDGTPWTFREGILVTGSAGRGR